MALRRILLLIIIGGIFLCGLDPQQRYTVEGSIENLTGMVYLTIDGEIIDSAFTASGKFSFNGSLSEPRFATVRMEEDILCYIFLEDASLSISGDLNHPESIAAFGSAANENYYAYLESKKSIYNNLFGPTASYTLDDIQGKIDSIELRLIENNSNNVLGLYFLARRKAYDLSIYKLHALFDKTAAFMQSHSYFREAVAIALSRQEKYSGDRYIPLSLPDQNGNDIALSDHIGKGKFILLDFWATWCAPCLSEINYLHDAYEKYHDLGFEIYSISLNKQPETWNEYIEKYDMEWINVNSNQGWKCPAAVQYGVGGIPSSFLISPDGHIIARDLRGEKLLDTLEQIYQ